MEEKFDVSKILDINTLKGKTLKEKTENCYKIIGQHLIDHSEKLAADTEPNTSEIRLKITIPYNFMVTLEKQTDYHTMNEKENENE